MSEEHKKQLGIPEGHTLVETDSKWEQRKGRDTDTYWYDEINENGVLVTKYVVKDSTSIYPPFGRSITWEKVG